MSCSLPPFRPDSLLAQSRRFKSGVELVPLTVTVTDRAGRTVPDLAAADFAIFEEGRRQAISHFASGDAPIDMGFLLDTSSSMRDNLPLAQKAARGLVRQLRAGDRGAVAGIGSTVVAPPAADVGSGAGRRGAPIVAGKWEYCPLRCVVYRAPPVSAGAPRRHRSQASGHCAHVGWHRHGEPRDVRGLLDLVRRVEATIYVVSLGEDPALSKNVLADRKSFESAHALKTLARESGGRLFTPRTARELPVIYDAIGQELRHQYVIGYLPSQGADGTFRRISVGVLEPRLGVARTRAGYYADRERTAASTSSYSGDRSLMKEDVSPGGSAT